MAVHNKYARGHSCLGVSRDYVRTLAKGGAYARACDPAYQWYLQSLRALTIGHPGSPSRRHFRRKIEFANNKIFFTDRVVPKKVVVTPTSCLRKFATGCKPGMGWRADSTGRTRATHYYRYHVTQSTPVYHAEHATRAGARAAHATIFVGAKWAVARAAHRGIVASQRIAHGLGTMRTSMIDDLLARNVCTYRVV